VKQRAQVEQKLIDIRATNARLENAEPIFGGILDQKMRDHIYLVSGVEKRRSLCVTVNFDYFIQYYIQSGS